MKTALCYYSRHHGNTLKVAQAMAGEGSVDLIDVTTRQAVHLEAYDRIGLASGIYYGKCHPALVQFARQYLPRGKAVFLVCTYGGGKGGALKALEQIARERDCTLVGAFGCKGYDTFGPFRLLGGIAKGHPNQRDLDRARDFYRSLPREEP